MAASATTISARSFGSSWRVSPRKKLFEITDYIYKIPIRFSETTSERPFVIRALGPQRGSKEADENSRKNEGVFISQDDLGYLSKLLVGSVVGAAAIKYGSAVYPVITRPNIVQALIMILTPVVIAVFLLIEESRLDRKD